MLITAQLFGDFKKYINDFEKKRWVGDLHEGASVENLIQRIGISSDKIVLVLVNDYLADLNHILSDNDDVSILTLLGGG